MIVMRLISNLVASVKTLKEKPGINLNSQI